MNRNDVDVRAHRRAYEGYFRLDTYTLRHKRFAGDWTGEMTRELFERGHAVGVLPYDPDRDRVVLLEQFRIGAYAAGDANPWLIEIPAGVIDAGEDARAVAHRETLEEAGAAITLLEPIATYYASPGGTSESITLFCGRVDSQGVGGFHGVEAENEDIRVFTLPADEAKSLLARGSIRNAVSLIALQWFALNHERIGRAWRRVAGGGLTP
jgi:ADP-ribose pyrophosphatase